MSIKQPSMSNYDLTTAKGKAKYTVDMINYKKAMIKRKGEIDALKFTAENSALCSNRMKYGRRFTYAH